MPNAYTAKVWAPDPVTSVLGWQPIAGTLDTSLAYTWGGIQTFNSAIYAPTAALGTNTTQVATTAFVLANQATGTFSPAISYNWTAVQTFNENNVYNGVPVFENGADFYGQIYADADRDSIQAPTIVAYANSQDAFPSIRLYADDNDSYASYRTTGGTFAARTPVTNNFSNGFSMFQHTYAGWNGTVWSQGATQSFYPQSTFSGTNSGTNYELSVRREGSNSLNWTQSFEATEGRLSGSGLSMSSNNWTPTFGPNATGWSFGTDTQFYCTYSVIGQQVFATINIIFGSTATWGTGIPLIELPGAGSRWGIFEAWNTGQIGSGYLVTTGGTYYKMEAVSDTGAGVPSNYIRPLYLNSSGATLTASTWTNANPTATISGSNLRLNLMYYTLV